MNEKEPSFEETPERNIPPTGLRASNTVKTLQPTEVFTTTAVQSNETMASGSFLASTPFTVHDDKPKEVVYRPTPEKPKNSYVPDSYAVQHIASGEFRPVSQLRGPLDARTTGLLLDRVEKLEDQVDALLDRIAKHNLKAAHRI